MSAPRASRRIAAATEFLLGLPPREPFLVVAHTRAAADALAMDVLERRGSGAALFGATRFAFLSLAHELAGPALARAGLRLLAPAAAQTLVVRLVHRFRAEGRLGRFEPVAEGPGLARRLGSTFRELRLAGIAPDRISAADPALGALYRAYAEALQDAGLADRARVLEIAAEAVRQRLPVVFLDVPLPNPASRRFAGALVHAAPEALIVAPDEDSGAERAATDIGIRQVAAPEEEPAAADAVDAAQRHLFRSSRPNRDVSREGLFVVDAPGVLAEAIEVASALLAEARRGVSFDRMAVLLSRPREQAPAFREALSRAGIPAFFESGARWPHPAGRAFLMLLDCALERLPANRVADYLAMGETPSGEAGFAAPRYWERRIRSSDVVGGLDRWERRFRELRARLSEDGEDDAGPGSREVKRLAEEVRGLSEVILPILRSLDALPERASQREWLDRLRGLARLGLRHPEGVLACLAEAGAADGAGELTLPEVRDGLAPRLREVVVRAPRSRSGRAWVGPIEAARGHSFAFVALPGLSERAFPQIVREDPILPDRRRSALSPDLPLRSDRSDAERLRLRLAVGASSGRLLLSFPSLNPAEGRRQVPSYYLAETFRAGFGRVPTLAEIRKAAAREQRVIRGIRAPREPALAIDRREFDLARVAEALGQGAGEPRPGTAAYLLGESSLARSLRQEYMRQARKWQSPDGFLNPGKNAQTALQRYRPHERSYSPTGLEGYSSCPYSFFLRNVAGLTARRHPVPAMPLDSLTRGSLLHEVFARLGARLPDLGTRPRIELRTVFREVEAIFREVEREYRERLSPPVRRIWDDEMDGLLGDLRGFLDRHLESGRVFLANERAFGMTPGKANDPSSTAETPVFEGVIRVHGSIDAVERRKDGSIQVTDYKTGRAGDAVGADAVLLGGQTLQPVLYARAWEALDGEPVASSRLYYATLRGAFQETAVNTGAPESREVFREFVAALDAAISEGQFAALPRRDRFLACDWCDFRAICGPRPASHEHVKPSAAESGRLAALATIRALP